MKLWIVLIVIALLVAPKAFAGDEPAADIDERDQAVTQSDERADEREAIEVHLAHHHQLPDRETLEKASDNARAIVFEIARDDDAFLLHRQRALKALALWPDDEVYEYLSELLEDEATENGLRHHLLPVLANGFGEEALDDLSPYLLENSDPQIRISAAGAIAEISGDNAGELLDEALETEEHPLVESRIEGFIDQRR